MRTRRLTRSIGVAALVATLTIVGTIPALAVDGDAEDYPTWDEVRAAQSSEQAAQAEYERLQGALQRTQAEAETASAAADAAAAAARQAEQDLADATTREQELQARVDRSQNDLSENEEAFGRMVSWLYTNGTGLASAGQLAASRNPEEFMARLSSATQVSGTWDGIAERAAVEMNSAASLKDQAETAKKERERLAKESETASAAAAQALQQADAAVAATSDRSATVYAQLASLRGTTADAERRYQIGLQVAAQAREQERQREAAAEQPGVGSGGGGGAPSGGGVSVDPAGAQAHARAVLPAYGWGDEQFPCLVSLWNGESGWRADALNPWSGAYGIPQALPAEKMANAGPDWRTNGNTQVDWGLAYISAVYGSPCGAWNTWNARNPHWY